MIRILIVLLTSTICFTVLADEIETLNEQQLIHRVKQVNALQNKVLMKNSTVEDANQLFAQYTNDFTYVHEVYGGTYTRKGLYKNTVKYLKQGSYRRTTDRYKVIKSMTGLNAISVLRKQDDGEIHLSVFEFHGDKVSKIIEYWR